MRLTQRSTREQLGPINTNIQPFQAKHIHQGSSHGSQEKQVVARSLSKNAQDLKLNGLNSMAQGHRQDAESVSKLTPRNQSLNSFSVKNSLQ